MGEKLNSVNMNYSGVVVGTKKRFDSRNKRGELHRNLANKSLTGIIYARTKF